MPRLLAAVSLALVTSWAASGQGYTVSTFAGGAMPGNLPGTSASVASTLSITVDKAGNVYFSAVAIHSVLRLDATTGVLTVVAGNGTPGFSGDNGPATLAQLDYPYGVAVDSAGNLYIADFLNNRIRKVTNGVITTFAGSGMIGFGGDNGPATSARIWHPEAVAVDAAGNLYITDVLNERIRKVSNGVITTLAGNGTAGYGGDNGPATSAQLNQPIGITVDSAGNVYFAERGNEVVRKVANGVITTVAGNGTAGYSGDGGPATSAQLNYPYGVTVDSAGNLYVAEVSNRRIRRVSGGTISTVAGTGTAGFSGDGGPATSAQLGQPYDVAVDSAGNLYIADAGNDRIRKVSAGTITTVAGNGMPGFSGDGGPPTSAQLNSPYGVAIDSAGSVYAVELYSYRVSKVSGGAISTVAGNGTPGSGGDNGPATSAQLYLADGAAADSGGNLYIADTGNNRIRKVANGVITTVAGNGTAGYGGDNGSATSAQLNEPNSIAVDPAGNLYIADANNSRIRKVANGVITTVAGNGTAGFSGDNGPATSAQLNAPLGVALDSSGNLYIADERNYRIRKVSGGVITTVAGSGTAGFSGDNGPATSAQLTAPGAIALDSAGALYIADNLRLRKVSGGVISTVAGNGTTGFSGDNGPATSAQFSEIPGVAVDSAGNVYIADASNNRIRILTPGTPPAISHGGVVPVYSPVPTIQPGSWASIYGSDLATGTVTWNGDFPMSLGGTSVSIDSKPAFLWYVSPTQINLQVPDDTATGLVNVAVTTASGTATSTVTLAAFGPSFSLLGDGKHVAAEIATPNGTGAYGGGTYDLVGPSNTFSYNTRPVKAGETLVLYGVGFGPTTPHVPAGQPFSGAAPTTTPVTVTIGGVPAIVAFSGLTMAGLYQINLTVPQGTGSGDQALAATVNGVQTPTGPVVAVQ